MGDNYLFAGERVTPLFVVRGFAGLPKALLAKNPDRLV